MDCQYPTIFAAFYDRIYHKIRDGVDNLFFLRHITEAKGKVLDAGVGTGRIFVEALINGVDIQGIDISSAMLDVLKSKIEPAQHARLSLQSITNFKFDFKFGLVIAPFRVMMHVVEKEEQLAALNNVWKHLDTGGKFIFDAFVPNPLFLVNGLDNEVDFDEEYGPGKRIRRIVSTHPDLINQIIHCHFRFESIDNNTVECEDWDSPMRFFFRYELEHLIERSAFGVNYTILGNYDSTPLSTGSKEFIVICVKK